MPGNATIASFELCHCTTPPLYRLSCLLYLFRQCSYRFYTIYTIASYTTIARQRHYRYSRVMSLHKSSCRFCATPLSPFLPHIILYLIYIASFELCHCTTPPAFILPFLPLIPHFASLFRRCHYRLNLYYCLI